MEEADLYCPLCDVGMSGWHPDAEELPSNYTADHWFEEIRVVYEERDTDGSILGSTFLSGVGYYIHDDYDDAWVPLDSKLSYRDVDEDSLEEVELFPDECNPRWGYAIHSSCWTLLRTKLANIKNEADITRALLHYLYTTPCPDTREQFQHDDNADIEVYNPPKYVLGAVDGASEGEVYSDQSDHYPDPGDVLPLNEIADAVAPGFSYTKYWSPPWTDASGPTNPDNNYLSALPPELIFHIFSYLPLAQVMCMRLVTRRFARIACWDNLPQSFWRSRFMLGNEMDFVLPDLSQGRDWARLFQGVHLFVEDEKGVLHHRRRVWKFLEFMECLARVEGMETRELSSSPQDNNKLGDEFSMNFLPVCWLSGTLSEYNHKQLMNDGCLELHRRIAQFPSQFPNAGRCEFRVSKIQVGPRTYISGIRYYCSESEGDTLTSLGFCTPPDEQGVGIPPNAKLQRICVAFSRRGLVGIKFDFVGIDDASSSWVGQNEGHDIAFGVLKLPKLFNQYHIVARLDVGFSPIPRKWYSWFLSISDIQNRRA